MKLIIEKAGVFDKDGEPVEVGSTITVEGKTVPAWLAGKVSVPTVSKDAELVNAKAAKK